jgi:hypothetical protein
MAEWTALPFDLSSWHQALGRIDILVEWHRTLWQTLELLEPLQEGNWRRRGGLTNFEFNAHTETK